MNTLKRKNCFYLFVLLLIPLLACSQIKDSVDEIYEVEELPVTSDENGWDIPANEGIQNALLNAEQLVKLKYTPIETFNVPGGKVNAGTTIIGLVYSSTRAEDLFVPNNVSLWTFMSSLKNPNSYLYTVDITQAPYSIRGLAKGFYGQVCSQFVQYALGIKYNIQIHQMTVWDGLGRVEPQEIDKLRLGDVLTTEKGHTRLVTGIHREDGHVVEIAISEGVTPFARRDVYPVEEIVKTFDEGYVFYRYRYINDTKHEQSPFVTVGSETTLDNAEMPNDIVIPRRGDKANWRKDERVVLDVLVKGKYKYYNLFNDEALIETKSIPDNNVLDFGVMPYGNYHLCLANDVEESPFAYWIVADYSISASAMGDRKVKVYFTSNNTTPIWVTWRRPANLDADNNNMPQWTTVITDTDRKNGYVITQLNEYTANRRGLGEWDFKVAFETEYGIISSDSETVVVY